MDGNSKIKIIIAEDYTLLRESIRLILENEPDFEIIGEAINDYQVIDMVYELKPDLLLLDISSPDFNGIDTIPVIKQKCPETKILLIALAIEDESLIIECLKAGARGYLSRNSSLLDIKRAIEVIKNNEMWVERKLMSRFFDNKIEINHPTNSIRQKKDADVLTTREQDVLRLLVRGSTNKEIAHDLFICEKTVKSHLNRIFRKLNVSRRLEAILYAIKSGMV